LKLTRLAGIALWTALAAAGDCAARANRHVPPRLRVRSPDLSRPLHERQPGSATPHDEVSRAVFRRINADRAAAGAAPVEWDEGAARVARRFCEAQIRERTRGHFLTDGVPPYARTALAGLFGVQAENSTMWLTTAREFQKSIVDLALDAHADMMGERPPEDGHRHTILDPDATHVGVGWAAEAGSFRMAQEFLTRRLEDLTLTRVAEAPATIRIEGKVASSYRLEFVTFAHEPSPRALTKSEANARTSYGYPPPRLAYVEEGRSSLHVVGAETEDRVRLTKSGEFSFRFTPTLAGLWTILVYTRDGRTEPRPGGLAVLWMEEGGAAP